MFVDDDHDAHDDHDDNDNCQFDQKERKGKNFIDEKKSDDHQILSQ